MKWRWRYQKCSMWCQKICRKCWYRCTCWQKKKARGETYPPVKSFLHCQIFKYGTFVDSFKMGHFILLYIVETQKFHLEHCKIKADFTLNVLLVRISVLWECFICKMLDHIALLRAIKKKKNFSRPTDRPCLKKGIYGQANYFFFLALLTYLFRVAKTEKKCLFWVCFLVSGNTCLGSIF